MDAQTEISSTSPYTLNMGYDKALDENPDLDEGSGELWGYNLETIVSNVRVYVMAPLCVIGLIFNFVSIGALFHNKLRLRKSLIQLFIFLNTFDA